MAPPEHDGGMAPPEPKWGKVAPPEERGAVVLPVPQMGDGSATRAVREGSTNRRDKEPEPECGPGWGGGLYPHQEGGG